MNESWPRVLTHIILMTRRGPNDFLGSAIFAKRDFCGSMKDARIFLGLQKNTLRDFLGYCSFHQLKSTIKQTQFTALCGIFMGMLRKFW